MRTRIVPTETLGSLSEEQWVDRTRRPYVVGNEALVPVRDGFPWDCDIPARRPYGARGYQMVGDIALVHGRRPSAEEVSAIVSWKHPRGVVWVRAYEGRERLPDTVVLYGTSSEVLHKENGVRYFLDPAELMFCQGNRAEKARMARLVAEGPENPRVADMFAGIGYFTIPMALAGASVDAMECNPAAFRMLIKNIAGNGVSGRVTPRCGDCRTLLSGKYDRIVMGHFDAPSMVLQALDHASEGSVLHVHSTGSVPPDLGPVLRKASMRASVVPVKVKKYAPGRWHYVQDVTLG